MNLTIASNLCSVDEKTHPVEDDELKLSYSVEVANPGKTDSAISSFRELVKMRQAETSYYSRLMELATSPIDLPDQMQVETEPEESSSLFDLLTLGIFSMSGCNAINKMVYPAYCFDPDNFQNFILTPQQGKERCNITNPKDVPLMEQEYLICAKQALKNGKITLAHTILGSLLDHTKNLPFKDAVREMRIGILDRTADECPTNKTPFNPFNRDFAFDYRDTP